MPADAWQMQHKVSPEVQAQLVHWRLVLVLHVHPVHVLQPSARLSVQQSKHVAMHTAGSPTPMSCMLQAWQRNLP